ncbi:amino acid/polyamine transporter I, partial [Kipferlia bialata]
RGPHFAPSIGVAKLVGLTFFVVAAGPAGIESAVNAAGGALPALACMVLVPLVYCLPMALLSSELSSKYARTGGVIEWCQTLGKNVGAVNGYLHFFYNIIDNALYPSCCCDYLSRIEPFQALSGGIPRVLFSLFLFCLSAVLNCMGLELVGTSALVFTTLVLLPFLAFMFLGLPSVTWAGLTSLPTDGNTVGASYILPVGVGVCVQPDTNMWYDGAFIDISRLLPTASNGWLALLLTLSGVLSSFGILQAAIGCTGRELYAMAALKHLPFSKPLLKLHRTWGTKGQTEDSAVPVVAIITQALLSSPFVFFQFEYLLGLDGLFTSLTLLLEVVAYINLRMQSRRLSGSDGDLYVGLLDSEADHSTPFISREERERVIEGLEDEVEGYVVPYGILGTIVVCLPLVVVSVAQSLSGGLLNILVILVLMALGLGVYHINIRTGGSAAEADVVLV